MKKYLSIIVIIAFFISCTPKTILIGKWVEVNYKKESIEFHEDGKMEIKKQGQVDGNPINFKYEIIGNEKNHITFNVQIFNKEKLFKTAKHKATFIDKDTIIIKNIDFPKTKSNTYFRK